MSLNNLFLRSSFVPLSSPEVSSYFSSLFTTAKSGVTVNQDTATRHTAVYACYIVLSEGVSGMPIHLMKRNGKTVEKATGHKLYNVLHMNPNDEMTSFTMTQALMLNLISRGNGYIQKIFNNRGNVVGLYPLLSDNMEIVRSERGDLAFVYNSSKHGRVWLSRDEVVNIPGHTLDGIKGMTPIEMNANSIGLSIALEEHGSNFFKNGANSTGAFKKDGVLSDEAYNRLKTDLTKSYAGLMNSGKPMILEDGLDFARFSISNNDSQFLESRKYQRSEIASIFKVPLHMINDLEKSSFNNMEQQSLDFVIHTLRPWVMRIEQALTVSLFGDDSEYFVKFNMAALLRGDTATRYEAYNKGINAGWLTRNEARAMEDLNPIDGLDEPILPLNMTTGESNENKN